MPMTMLEQIASLIPLPFLQLAVPGTVIVFLLYFAGRYLIECRKPAKRLQKHLLSVTQAIDELRDRPPNERRAALAGMLKGTSLAHPWQEFDDTLHDQQNNVDGEMIVTRSRATVSSAYFFSAQKIIETPLKTEYFKHLPGILTGLGIIGTFGGLLIGLTSFNPADPAKVQESLKLLLSGVRDAFVASAIAITLAMYITNSEKQNLRKCIEYLENLTDAIDRLFETGVGEEYLADLVRHTQESSVQTRLLKDSLVTDLREMLQNLVDSQVRENVKLGETLSLSYKDAAQDMATQISASIEGSFREPLDQIAKSVQTATGDQTGKVNTLMQDLLVSFMQKIESSFGSQFGGMQEMLSQSIASMQSMQGAFAGLVQDMRVASESSGQAVQEQLARTLAEMQSGQAQMHAKTSEMVETLQAAIGSIGAQGQHAGAQMAEQLERIFTQSEARQQAMGEQMQAFVESIKNSVGKGHEDTMQRIALSVDQLGSHLSGVLGSFEQNRAAMDQSAQAAQNNQQEQIAKTLETMQQAQERMQEMMTGTLEGLRSSVATIGNEGELAGERIGQQLERQFAQNEVREQQRVSENEARHQAASEQLHAFIENIRSSVGKGHEEAMQHIASSVGVLGERLNGVLGAFEQNRSLMDQAALSAQESQQEHIGKAVTTMHETQERMQAMMNETLAGLQSSVANIGKEGEQAGQLIGTQLEKQHQLNEVRQQEMARQIEILIQTTHELISKGQHDTMQRIAGTVEELTGKLGGLISSFERNRQSMDSAALAAQQQLHVRTKEMLDDLGGQVRSLIQSVGEGQAATRETIRLLGEQTERNLNGMQAGAEKIRTASDGFTAAGQEVVRVGQTAGNLASQLQTTAAGLGMATGDLGAVVEKFQSHQDGLHKSIGIIESIVSNAQAEAGMRGKVLDDLRSVNERMQSLNEEARDYLQQVTGVLGRSFDSFGLAVEKSLERSLATFDLELDRAIRALGGGVNDLSENIETFGDIVEKSVRRHA
jgi:putative membrane protein